MKNSPVTYGQLADLLIELGFKSKVFDERRVIYRDKASDSLFTLPNGPPETVAAELDVKHVRYQLHWRGLMEFADFDAHFASLAAAKS